MIFKDIVAYGVVKVSYGKLYELGENETLIRKQSFLIWIKYIHKKSEG